VVGIESAFNRPVPIYLIILLEKVALFLFSPHKELWGSGDYEQSDQLPEKFGELAMDEDSVQEKKNPGRQ